MRLSPPSLRASALALALTLTNGCLYDGAAFDEDADASATDAFDEADATFGRASTVGREVPAVAWSSSPAGASSSAAVHDASRDAVQSDRALSTELSSDDAPRGTNATRPPSTAPAETWSGVAAAPDVPGVLAVWNDRVAAISSDDGAHFARVLDGPALGDVTAATMAYGGALHVLRGHRYLGTRSATGAERWSRLPTSCSYAILAANREAVAVYCNPGREGASVLFVSRDAGVTFEQRSLPADGNFGHELRLDADGTLFYWTGSEAPCGGGFQSRWRSDVDHATWQSLAWPFDAPFGVGFGAHGWVYAWEQPDAGAWSGIHEADTNAAGVEPTTDAFDLVVATNGRQTLATEGGRLLALRGAGLEVLATGVPSAFQLRSVDASGRAVGVEAGRVRRWSRRGGWRDVVVTVVRAANEGFARRGLPGT